MAEDRKLGGLYVEVISKGMQQIQAEMDNLRSKLANLEVTPGSDLLEQVKRDIAGLPKELRIRVVADKLATATAQVRELQEQLRKTPHSIEIQAKLAAAQDLQAGLQKLTAGAGGNALAGLSAVVSGAVASFGKLADAIDKAGRLAAVSFAAGTASVTKLISAADPAGMMRLQGTLGAISVQLGSIFLPILDSVHAALQRFLSFLRSLSDAQKDQIVHWTKVVGAIALGVAILPKLVGAFRLATSAMQLFGITSAIATGGLTLLLGLLGASAAGFALMGHQGEEAEGGLSGLLGALKPLVDGLTQIGGAIMEAVKPVVPILVDLGKTMIEALTPLLALVAEVAKELGTVLAEAIKELAPVISETMGALLAVFKTVIDAIKPILEPLAASIKAIVEAAVPVISAFVQAIGSILKALQPVIGVLATAFAAGVIVMVQAVTALLKILQPVFDLLAKLVEDFGDIFAEVMDSLTPLIELFGEAIEQLGPTFAAVFEGIVDGLQVLQPVFELVFGAIRIAIEAVAKSLIFVGKLISEISKGNLTGALSEALQAVEDFDKKIAARKQEREDKRADAELDRLAKEAEKEQGDKDKAKGRHSGQTLQKVELTGIADLWRKAQQATIETPEQKKQQEILNTQKESLSEEKKHTRLLEKLAGEEQQSAGATFTQ